jgi:transposase
MTKPNDEKAKALRRRNCLNPEPDRVKDELFDAHEFFDSQDLVQVKYEMLRRVRAGEHTVSRAAAEFGFSRPSFYEAQRQFDKAGLVGLVPKKRGPRGGHKLTPQVVDGLIEALAEDSSLTTEDLVELVLTRFGRRVHRRSVERALARRKKNSR